MERRRGENRLLCTCRAPDHIHMLISALYSVCWREGKRRRRVSRREREREREGAGARAKEKEQEKEREREERETRKEERKEKRREREEEGKNEREQERERERAEKREKRKPPCVYVQNASVCTVRTSACVPATGPHVFDMRAYRFRINIKL